MSATKEKISIPEKLRITVVNIIRKEPIFVVEPIMNLRFTETTYIVRVIFF